MQSLFIFFFFNDTATTEIYTLSLHDALPICPHMCTLAPVAILPVVDDNVDFTLLTPEVFELREMEAIMLEGEEARSEEHTSELQSHLNLVCRLLLEKKKKKSTLDLRTIVLTT